MAFGGLIMTNRGRNLQVKAQLGTQLKFTRMALGDGELGGSSISELNALKREVKSLPLSKYRRMPEGQALVGAVLSNQDIVTGFYFREIGIFAQDPDVGEVLYSYGNAGATAEYIPAGGGADILEKSIDVITIVGNAANVSATINSSLVFIPAAEKGEPYGVAELDEGGKVPSEQLPTMDYVPTSDVGVPGGVATQDEFESHKAEEATDTELGHIRLSDIAITDPTTGDKYKWGVENGRIFLEKVV